MPPSQVPLVSLLALVAACGDQRSTSRPAAEQFEARGRIAAISAREVEIHHERIAAIRTFDGKLAPMASMTMPFGTAGVSTAGLAAGDLVSFAFSVHYDAGPTLRLTRLDRLPAGTTLELP